MLIYCGNIITRLALQPISSVVLKKEVEIMFKINHDLNVKSDVTKIEKGMFMFVAKAEEPEQGSEPQSQPEQPTKTVNFEDLITKARAEEKAKLYPKIQKLEGEKAELVEKNNKLLLDLGTKDAEISDLKSQIEKTKSSKEATESETVKALKDEIKTLKATIKDMESNAVDVDALTESIRGEYDVKLYREQRLREVGETVIPELVMGTTKEEIDASITNAQARFNDIIAKHGATHVTPTVTPNNVNTQSLNVKDLSVEDISRMTPEEWAEKRKMLGFK